MKRFLPATLGLSLLLSGCQDQYPMVKVAPNNAALPQGQWQAKLSESLTVQAAATSDSTAYLLSGNRLLAVRLSDGTRLAETTLSNANQVNSQVVYRTDGQLVLLTVDGATTTLSLRDPLTLAETSQRTFTFGPANDLPQLSADGETFWTTPHTSSSTLYSTRSGEKLLTADPIAGPLVTDSASQWWKRSNEQIINRAGQTLSVTSQHPKCVSSNSASFEYNLTALETLPGTPERLVLGSSNGQLSARDTGGKELAWLDINKPGTCTSIASLSRTSDANTVAYLTSGEYVGQNLPQSTQTILGGTWNISTGQHQQLEIPVSAVTGRPLLTAQGILSQSRQQTVPTLHKWNGESWTLAKQQRLLKLNLTFTRTSEQGGVVGGTGTVDGENLSVEGTLRTGTDAKLSAQSRAYQPYLYLDLKLKDGSGAVRYTASGMNNVDTKTTQTTSGYPLSVYDSQHALAFSGDLVRP